ncbi:AlwI family type II restriction endonuclease [Breznakiellaceae bacterium SP9]
MKFWSISTTVRNPERIRRFLFAFKELEGEEWTHEAQAKFQFLLLQQKLYGIGNPEFEKTLSAEQLEWLYSENLTYEQARNIVLSKNYVGGADMRGRQSLNPIKKLGFVYLNDEKQIVITPLGAAFLAENYDLGDIFFRSLLKWQYPNPDASDYPEKDGYTIKPLIATLHLIKKVNNLCAAKHLKEKGVSKTEFAIFFITVANYKNIDSTANALIDFRKGMEGKTGKAEKDAFAKQYFELNYREYDSWGNAIDYADNVIRYFRLTRLFYLRGNGFYIDLEPRRRVEIESLLEIDNAAALTFKTKFEYAAYLGDITKPELPWENRTKLQNVIDVLLQDIETAENELHNKNLTIPLRPQIVKTDDTETLKELIDDLRNYRLKLFDIETHAETQELDKIENCISSLQSIFTLAEKRPVELERMITLGLYILNDAIGIKPNYPVGDDNQPTFTAPANKPDIECFYKSFNSICEVTMLSNRSQWINEGQPVMRHFRDFEIAHNKKQSYCLFVAPKIHRDTINTFWFAIKYEYEGQKQNIIPVTIQQFTEILQFLLTAKKQKQNYHFTHTKIQELFDCIISETKTITSAPDWLAKIPSIISTWGQSVVA